MTKEEAESGIVEEYDETDFQLKVDSFEQLIDQITFRDVEASPEERRQLMTEQLTFEDFTAKVTTLFYEDFKAVNLKNLYRKITTNPDAKIDWTEIFGYQSKEKVESKKDEKSSMPSEENTVFMLSKRQLVGDCTGNVRKRDSVRFLKYNSIIDAVLSVTEKGIVTIWNHQMKLLSTYEIDEPFWCTCIEYLQNMRRILVATERSFHIFDHRAQDKSQNMFAIKPLHESPLCMTWVPLHKKHVGEDTVLFGDTQGYINLVTITVNDLVPKQRKGDKGRTYQSFTLEPKELEYEIVRRKFCDDWITRISYYPLLKCFACCSPSTKFSFYLEQPERVTDNVPLHPVGIYKGVNAFGFCARANVVITGGVDKIIRVWHPHIWKRPNGKLGGHMFTICDIVVNEKDQHIVSLSTARIFRVWDIQMLACLQTFSDTEERPGERRIYSMSYDPRHERLITGSSVIECWPLTRTVQEMLQVPQTHEKSLVGMIYNPNIQQLATVCSESVIKVWEVDSGKFIYSITDPHGEGIEVTCLNIDKSGYKLVSGAVDGSIYIWDFGSGQELSYRHGTQTDFDFSILSVAFCTLEADGKKVIVAFGWSGRLRMLLESSQSRELMIWKDFDDAHFIKESSSVTGSKSQSSETDIREEVEEDESRSNLLASNEITCMCTYLSQFVLTGCANGNIIKWDVQSGKVETVFQLPEAKYPPGHIALQGKTAFNVVDIKILEHKRRYLDPIYLKKISKKKDEDSESDEDQDQDETKQHQSSKEKDGENVSIKQDTTANDMEDNDDDEDITSEMSNSEMDDPNKHILVDVYPPMIASAHQDGLVRFWSLDGELVKVLLPETKNEAALTAIGTDADCNYILAADYKGYVTMIQIADFLKEGGKGISEGVSQLVFWKAHTAKIVSITFVEEINVFLTASVDCSVRVWWGVKGRYIGYVGQAREFRVPVSDETAGQQFLPYDITEWPQVPQRSSSAKQTARVTRNVKYPLKFHESLWDPFSRTQFIKELQQPPRQREPLDQKFFKAVVKQPHFDLRGSISGKATSGFVFGSLPIYTVNSVDHVTELPKDLNVNTTFGKYNVPSSGSQSKMTSRQVTIIEE